MPRRSWTERIELAFFGVRKAISRCADTWREDLALKCPKCGADNPDYAFFCGRCAADLKADATGPASLKKSIPSIYSMLSRRLLRLEENMQRGSHGALGRIRESLHRGGEIAFKSESEVATLVLGKDRHASITNGPPSKAVMVFEGPSEAFVEMFPESGGFGYLPDSVSVTLRGSEMQGAKVEPIIRQLAEEMLKGLFQQHQSK